MTSKQRQAFMRKIKEIGACDRTKLERMAR
jgi:hypothetical protein